MGKIQLHYLDTQLGQRIRIYRMILGLTQEQLGKEIGVSTQQLQKYEKGVNRLSVGRLFQVAEALGISPLELLADDRHISPLVPQLDTGSTPNMQKHDFALLSAFKRISVERTQKLVVELVELLGK